MANHPSSHELSDFVLGTLAPEATDVVAGHLEHCSPCRQTVRDFDAHKDTLAKILRRPSPPPVDAACQRAIDKVTAIGVAKKPAAASDAPSIGSPPTSSSIKERVFGEYVILEQIGAGGMGQVFKARHRSMDRIVALKILARSDLGSPDAVKRFQREVQAAAKLMHPNIIIAHDAGQYQGLHYLVMEYVDGADLSAIVRRDGPLPLEKALDYLLQTASGLAFAHGKGIVHRDIKPANLLVDSVGTVKILDMGLARFDDSLSDARAAQEGLTQSGQVMGTVDYMAPEQALDTRAADARADIYSLGCTFYRLLTGENVYSGETLVQKLLAHREESIPSLSARRPDVTAPVDALFRKMVAKLPSDRYQTMREVIEAIEEARAFAPSRPAPAIAADRVTAGAAPDSHPQSSLPLATSRPPAHSAAKSPTAARMRPTRRWIAAAGVAAAIPFIVWGTWVVVRGSAGTVEPHLVASANNTAPANNTITGTGTKETAPPAASTTQPAASTTQPAASKTPPAASKTPPAASKIQSAAQPTPSAAPTTRPAAPTTGAASSPLNAPPPLSSIPAASPQSPVAQTSVPQPSVRPSTVPQSPVTQSSVTQSSVTQSPARPVAPESRPASLSTATAAPKQRREVFPAALFTFDERGQGVKEFGHKISDLLFARLAAEPSLYLVDRVELQKTLAEQSLNVSGAVDPDKAVEVGRLTGAQLLVTGSVLQVDKQLVLVAKIISTESSRVIGASVEGKITDDLSPLVKELAAAITRTINERADEIVPDSVPVRDRLASLEKVFAGRRGKQLPKLWISVPERHIGAAVADPAVETELTRFATTLGFTVFDKEQGSIGQSDVTLSGEGISETIGRVGDMTAVRARVELKGVHRETGKVLFADRQTVVLVGASEQIAGKSALQEAAAILAERSLPKLAETADK
jgi:serine/threonine protein kinase